MTHWLSLLVLLMVLTSFTPEQCTRDPKTGRLIPPPLAFDVLAAIEKQLPGFPIVLHGSSSVPQEYVDIINEHGGKLPNAVGIPEDQLRQAAKSAVCKINIDSDSRLAFTAGVRQTFDEHPEYFDPRQYCGKAREYMEDLYKHKITDVLGSDNKLVKLRLIISYRSIRDHIKDSGSSLCWVLPLFFYTFVHPLWDD